MTRVAVLGAILLAWLAAAPQALAHTRDRIFSTWYVDGPAVTATVRLPARLVGAGLSDAQSKLGWRKDLAGQFVRTLKVSIDGRACTARDTPIVRTSPGGMVFIDLTWTCGTKPSPRPARKLSIRVDSLFDRLPNHVHFARFRLPHGRMDEHVFTFANRLHTVDLQSGAAHGGRSWIGLTAEYVQLGITHILAGADHLAFVLGLLMIAANLRGVLFVVTGFTLGHSLTLALAATGAVTPVPSVIEALIGFTVAIVAAEASAKTAGRNLSVSGTALPLAALAMAALFFGSALPPVTWAGLVLFAGSYALLTRRIGSGRWAVALAATFGLVHGFGFAGVLQEVGLPPGRQVASLLGFNVGVEIGQLSVVALALAASKGALRLLPGRRARIWSTQALAAALCGLGTFWFVSRAFAG